jgi:Cu/Ag efflux protein CusF
MPTRRFFLALAGTAALASLAAGAPPASAQQAEQAPPQHIRGTLKSVGDGKITVQTPRGRTDTVALPANAGVFLVTPADLSAIKPGRFVGVTSVEQGGKRVAREVHVFEESLRGLGEGHYPWDLESGPNMMTNANIAQVQEVGADRVLRLNYKGGEQTIDLPPNVTVVAFDKTTPDQLVPGRQVFVIARKGADGALTANGVVVGAEGVKPPM